MGVALTAIDMVQLDLAKAETPDWYYNYDVCEYGYWFTPWLVDIFELHLSD